MWWSYGATGAFEWVTLLLTIAVLWAAILVGGLALLRRAVPTHFSDAGEESAQPLSVRAERSVST